MVWIKALRNGDHFIFPNHFFVNRNKFIAIAEPINVIENFAHKHPDHALTG